jgi:hypothetical protein
MANKIEIDLDWLRQRSVEEENKVKELNKGTTWFTFFKMGKQQSDEVLKECQISLGKMQMISEILNKFIYDNSNLLTNVNNQTK